MVEQDREQGRTPPNTNRLLESEQEGIDRLIPRHSHAPHRSERSEVCTDSDEQTSDIPNDLSREQRVPARRDSDADDQALRPLAAHFTRSCSPLIEDGPPQPRRGGQMTQMTWDNRKI